jgi:hypothetical protein
MICHLVVYHYTDDTRVFHQPVRAYTVDHAKGILSDFHWDNPIVIDKVEVV